MSTTEWMGMDDDDDPSELEYFHRTKPEWKTTTMRNPRSHTHTHSMISHTYTHSLSLARARGSRTLLHMRNALPPTLKIHKRCVGVCVGVVVFVGVVVNSISVTCVTSKQTVRPLQNARAYAVSFRDGGGDEFISSY